jgi:hypothetical protein
MNLISLSANDSPSMKRIGQWFFEEIETEWKSASRNKDAGNETIVMYTQAWRQALMEDALSYQVTALRGGTSKESDSLRKLTIAKKLNWRRIDSLVESYPLLSADTEVIMNKARSEIVHHRIIDKKTNQIQDNPILNKIFQLIDSNSVLRESNEFWILHSETKLL